LLPRLTSGDYGTYAVSVNAIFVENFRVSKPKALPWLKQLGDNIRRNRAAQRISQQQLAECAELDIRTVQRIEAGEVNVLLITTVRLAKALGCSLDRLLPKT
jgi:DNA-binding XRE family transcriptional regulator